MQPPRHISVEEYLAIGLRADGSKKKGVTRYEYHAGEIFAVDEASQEHARMVRNVATALRNRLGSEHCRTATSDLRVKIGQDYTYPDVVMVCGRADLTDERPPSLCNPQLIVEVLSESTAERDKDWKMRAYLQIPTLKEYWILEHQKRLVLQYHRLSGEWGQRTLSGETEKVVSDHLNLSIPIEEFYRTVKL